jgi:hypothetical protein
MDMLPFIHGWFLETAMLQSPHSYTHKYVCICIHIYIYIYIYINGLQVLEALVALTLAAKSSLRGSEACTRVAGVLLAECARKNRVYRIGVLKAAAKFMKEFGKDVECAGQVLDCVADIFESGAEAQQGEAAARPAVSAGREADEEDQYQAKMVRTCLHLAVLYIHTYIHT